MHKTTLYSQVLSIAIDVPTEFCGNFYDILSDFLTEITITFKQDWAAPLREREDFPALLERYRNLR